MNNLYKRPMFRKGGSAEGGITSGLGRPGYEEGEEVKKLTNQERLLQAVGAQPSKQNFNDFLINFGLNMASNAPSGNIFQTAAAQAKDPYADFSKANQAEQNLLRQVGLEGASLDIKNEADISAAKLIEAGKDRRQTATLEAQKEQYADQKAELKQQEKNIFVEDYLVKNYTANKQEAENMYEWKYNVFDKVEYKNVADGGVIPKGILSNPKKRSNHASKQKNKNAIFFDKERGEVLKIGVNENGDITYIPVESFTETSEIVAGKEPTYTGEFSENPSYKRKPKEFKLEEKDPLDPFQP